MRISPYIMRVLALLAWAGVLSRGEAQTLVSSVQSFDSLVKNYNLITFGNATFAQPAGDTEAGLAVGGTLTWSGGGMIASTVGAVGTEPTLYLSGNLVLSSPGTTTAIKQGTAYLPNVTNTTNGWALSQSNGAYNLTKNGNGTFTTLGSTAPADNPTTGTAPWTQSWTQVRTSFANLSSLFNSAANTGTVGWVENKKLTFIVPPNTAAGSVIVFDFDSSLYSNIQEVEVSVPSGVNAVINVLNASGTTLFANANFIGSSTDAADQVIWNIVGGSTASPQNVGLGATNFYGSILATNTSLTNSNALITGQVVAASFTQNTAKELHFSGFAANSVLVPEPQTYGLMAAALGGFALVCRRRLMRLVAGGSARD